MAIDTDIGTHAELLTPQFVRQVHDKLARGDLTMIAWGAGEDYHRLVARLPRRPLFIVDRDARKHGSNIDGVPVVPADRLAGRDPTSCVVVIFSDAFTDIVHSMRAVGDFTAVPALALTNLPELGRAPLTGRQSLKPGDYVSPNMAVVLPDAYFPNMSIGDRAEQHWAYHRKTIDHNFYCDWRRTGMGFLNRDEAHILHHNMLPFAGKHALEIGCWMGWSACHFGLAGVYLDIIDPILGNPAMATTISASLTAAGVMDRISFWPGTSPDEVLRLGAQGRRWSAAFIDGDHDAPAPRLDAEAVEPLLEQDALVLFHDLTSPEVGEGLDVFRDRGWQTAIYHTVQIMGIAWRGAARPVPHLPDPRFTWETPPHLASHEPVPAP